MQVIVLEKGQTSEKGTVLTMQNGHNGVGVLLLKTGVCRHGVRFSANGCQVTSIG